jgi:signal transduction histidine kinase
VGKFRQIVFNLTSNAIKNTKTGAIVLSLVDRHDDVLFRVRDTGTGITPTEAERLFDSFWQSRTAKALGGGTGLGLTITRQLARLLGGDVELESSTEHGSIFLVRLPYDKRYAKHQ